MTKALFEYSLNYKAHTYWRGQQQNTDRQRRTRKKEMRQQILIIIPWTKLNISRAFVNKQRQRQPKKNRKIRGKTRLCEAHICTDCVYIYVNLNFGCFLFFVAEQNQVTPRQQQCIKINKTRRTSPVVVFEDKNVIRWRKKSANTRTRCEKVATKTSAKW